jgi:hypothetical protein
MMAKEVPHAGVGLSLQQLPEKVFSMSFILCEDKQEIIALAFILNSGFMKYLKSGYTPLVFIFGVLF